MPMSIGYTCAVCKIKMSVIVSIALISMFSCMEWTVVLVESNSRRESANGNSYGVVCYWIGYTCPVCIEV